MNRTKSYYTSRWRCKISLLVMKNISLVSAAQFSPCKKRGKAHVGICPLSSWVSVWLVCRWREIFRLLQLYQIQIFFIFRTINSILIHKLNYKEHNEKRKNIYKLNSCLFFFLSFCRREDTTKDKYHYSLTWTCEFPNEKDTYYFAHCYPYTYSDLQVCSFCFSSLLCYHFFTLECPSLLIDMRNFGKDELFRVKSWVKTIPNLSNLTYRTSYMKEGRKRKVKNYVLLISFVSSVWPKIQFTSWSGRKYE